MAPKMLCGIYLVEGAMFMIQLVRGHGSMPNSCIGCVAASFQAESCSQPERGI